MYWIIRFLLDLLLTSHPDKYKVTVDALVLVVEAELSLISHRLRTICCYRVWHNKSPDCCCLSLRRIPEGGFFLSGLSHAFVEPVSDVVLQGMEHFILFCPSGASPSPSLIITAKWHPARGSVLDFG